MAKDDLLERLARALEPGEVEPPAQRVQALRQLVEARAPQTVQNNGAAASHEPSPSQDATIEAVAESVPFEPGPSGPAERRTPGPSGPAERRTPGPGNVLSLSDARGRRTQKVLAAFPRILSGAVAVAALVILIAMVAVQDLPSPIRQVAHGVGLPVDSTELVAARRDADDLALALARRNAAQVAEADKAMLGSTNKLEGDELNEVRPRVVKLHLEALAFLRENPTPEALSDLPSPADAGATLGNGADVAAPGTPRCCQDRQTRGAKVPGSTVTPTGPPVPTTIVTDPPTVTIVGVTPRLDATFQVDFGVSGFTPGPGAPYSVRFSFDDAQQPSVWSGPSPWRFSLLEAVRYRRVCADVVDPAGVVQPDSGNCFDIRLI